MYDRQRSTSMVQRTGAGERLLTSDPKPHTRPSFQHLIKAHWTLADGARLLPLQPFVDAGQVEVVLTFRPDRWVVCTKDTTHPQWISNLRASGKGWFRQAGKHAKKKGSYQEYMAPDRLSKTPPLLTLLEKCLQGLWKGEKLCHPCDPMMVVCTTLSRMLTMSSHLPDATLLFSPLSFPPCKKHHCQVLAKWSE